MEEKKYLPLYKTEEYGDDKYICTSLKLTLEDYIASSETKSETILTFAKLIQFLQANNYIDIESQKIISMIAQNKKILEKLVFINDGSFRTHRIWFDVNGSRKIKLYSMHIKDKSIEETLKFFEDNYEKIFIQLSQHLINQRIPYCHDFDSAYVVSRTVPVRTNIAIFPLDILINPLNQEGLFFL